MIMLRDIFINMFRKPTLVLVLICGILFSGSFEVYAFKSISLNAEAIAQTAAKRRRAARLIIHRNSGKTRTAVCRDGSISLSRNRRGTYSHHGGVARWLR